MTRSCVCATFSDVPHGIEESLIHSISDSGKTNALHIDVEGLLPQRIFNRSAS